MDIKLTRAMVHAALSGDLRDVEYDDDPLFHVAVPRSCPGVPSEILNPERAWADASAYRARAEKLAGEFAAHFASAYGGKGIDPAVAAECPGL